MAMDIGSSTSLFWRLPQELRDIVYDRIFRGTQCCILTNDIPVRLFYGNDATVDKDEFELPRWIFTSRRLHDEALQQFYRKARCACFDYSSPCSTSPTPPPISSINVFDLHRVRRFNLTAILQVSLEKANRAPLTSEEHYTGKINPRITFKHSCGNRFLTYLYTRKNSIDEIKLHLRLDVKPERPRIPYDAGRKGLNWDIDLKWLEAFGANSLRYVDCRIKSHRFIEGHDNTWSWAEAATDVVFRRLEVLFERLIRDGDGKWRLEGLERRERILQFKYWFGLEVLL